MVLSVAVGTQDAVVGALRVLAGGRVLLVEGGDVLARALVAVGGPGTAYVGSVAPFKACRALPRSLRDRPREASSHDTYKGDGSL